MTATTVDGAGQAPPSLWTGQYLQAIALPVLLAATGALWARLGAVAPVAFWCAVAVPVCHQTFVWLCWRLQLRSGVVARTVGFRAFLATFLVLFFGRFVSLGVLGWVDRGSLGLPAWLQVTALIVLLVPGGYAAYSTVRYFGIARAVGADHFRPEYRSLPLVKEGIFRFTNNGMYVFVFLLFWALALRFDSVNALLVAAFSHAYIWVHYFATEKPDMDYLYGSLQSFESTS